MWKRTRITPFPHRLRDLVEVRLDADVEDGDERVVARVVVVALDGVGAAHLAPRRARSEGPEERVRASEVGLLGPAQIHERLLEEAVRLDGVHGGLEAREELDALAQDDAVLGPLRDAVAAAAAVVAVEVHAVGALRLLLLARRLVVVDAVLVLLEPHGGRTRGHARGRGRVDRAAKLHAGAAARRPHRYDNVTS